MKRPVVHLICNAHLDPIWMWTWKEGLREAISTFRTAVDLLNEFPEFIFNHNESLLYEWVEEYDSGLFKEIQELVTCGRWHIAGGFYLQPDLNICGGETLVRHILTGRNYFKNKFAVQPKVAYNFDTFGHPSSLPQLLTQAGYELYIHCRPRDYQLSLPDALYRWQGCDGSQIAAIRPLTGFYNSNKPGEAQEKALLGIELAKKLGRDVMVLWGLGDHGGGATRKDLNRFRELIKIVADSDCELRHSTPEDFLEGIRPGINNLPVFSGELQRTHPGTYTSIAPIKRSIRETEALLASAERESAIVWWRSGLPYPAERLNKAWKDLLFNTFHDTASGTILEEALPEVMDIFGSARDAARRIMIKAQHALLPDNPAAPDTMPVYVFNPHTCQMRAPVGINFISEHNSTPAPKALSVFDHKGHQVNHQEHGGPQILQTTNWQPYVGFIADVPALSFRRYEIHFNRIVQKTENSNAISETETGISVQTKFWKATFDRSNASLSQLSKGNQLLDILSAPVQLFVMEDSFDAWGGENRTIYNQRISAMKALTPDKVAEFNGLDDFEGPALRVLHAGPVSTTIECLVGWRYTRASIQYTFYADLPYFDLNIRLFMAARNKMIKFVFPFTLPAVSVISETAYGAANSSADGSEFPSGRWVRLENSAYSIGVANSGQSGFDVLPDGTLELSISRGAVHIGWEGGPALDPMKSYTWMDQGQIDTRFRILAENDPIQNASALVSAALSLNQPFESFFAFYLPTLPANGPEEPLPFLEIEPANVILGALKKADHEDALVVRLVETIGQRTLTAVKLENEPQQAFILEPYQVKTFLIRRNNGITQWQESNLMEIQN